MRLVGDNVEVGVYSLSKALFIAQDLELDLVEISPNASPPVCKILEYKKFLYEQKKREKALKAKSTKIVVSLREFLSPKYLVWRTISLYRPAFQGDVHAADTYSVLDILKS